MSSIDPKTDFQTGHVGINVTDLDRAVRFYERVFGFTIAGRSDEAPRRFAFLKNGDTLALTLWQQSAGRFDGQRPGLHHLSFHVPTLADVRAAAAELVAGGIETVVVSLGRHGALAVDASAIAHASAHIDNPVSTVGAGDSLLAGYLHAVCRGAGLREALATGVAWGAAAVSLPGSRMPTPADVAAIHVVSTDTPDLHLTLSH